MEAILPHDGGDDRESLPDRLDDVPPLYVVPLADPDAALPERPDEPCGWRPDLAVRTAKLVDVPWTDIGVPRMDHHQRHDSPAGIRIGLPISGNLQDRDIAVVDRIPYRVAYNTHPLFESVRRRIWDQTQSQLRQGAVFYTLQQDQPSVMELFVASVVDGTGGILHRRLFVVETGVDGTRCLRDPASILDLIVPETPPQIMPSVATDDQKTRDFLFKQGLVPFQNEVSGERAHELDLIERSVRACFDVLIKKRDEVLNRHLLAQDKGDPSAVGLAENEAQKVQELQRRRDLRMRELERQRSLSLQGVERLGLVLVMPHPERNAPGMAGMRCDRETERKAVETVIAYEQTRGCTIEDVQTANVGFDLRSLHPQTGENRLIEVKGIGAATGTICLSPNEKRVAEDRPDLYWLYVVTNCDTVPELHDPIPNPARYPWHEVRKVEHYRLDVNALKKPMTLKEDVVGYGSDDAGKEGGNRG